jgi:hypothetical protein
MNSEQNPIISVILVPYFASVGIFSIYYNWQYAQKHGFWEWIFFGEVVATFKAFIWPYFVFIQ